jgi:putative glutamine amidotransferase
MKKIIGISAPWSHETFIAANITSDFYYVATEYTDAVHAAGGIPFIIAPHTLDNHLEQTAASIMERIDALLLTGGGDIGINKSSETKQTLVEQQRRRYEFEALLVRLAWDHDIPVLGICRGHQMIAEVLGGSIRRDFIKGHTSDSDGVDIQHNIIISKDSRLKKIIKADEWVVNSYHKQDVCALPACLAISAVSEDGVIEAIEAAGKRFFMGVQFHPELLLPDDEKAKKIFTAFLDSVSGSSTVQAAQTSTEYLKDQT